MKLHEVDDLDDLGIYEKINDPLNKFNYCGGIYPVIRSIVISRISKNNNTISMLFNKNKLKVILLNFYILLYSIIKNKKRSKKEDIYLESADRIDGNCCDQYMYFLTKSSNTDVLLRPITNDVSFKNLNKYLKKKNIINTMYKQLIIYYFLKLKLFKIITNIIFKDFDKFISQNELVFIRNDILKYLIFYKFSSNIKYYKRMILYCGYNVSSLALIKLCNINNIETYEVQHGFFFNKIGSYHYINNINHVEQTLHYANNFYYIGSNSLRQLKQENSFLKFSKFLNAGVPISKTINYYGSSESYIDVLLVLPYDLENLDYEKLKYLLINKDSIIVRFHPSTVDKDIFRNKFFFQRFVEDKNPWALSLNAAKSIYAYESFAYYEALLLNKNVKLLTMKPVFYEFYK